MQQKYGADFSLPHQERYDKWAPDYNKNVLGERQYEAPEILAGLVVDICNKRQVSFSPSTPGVKVMDVGCGTGLAGAALAKKGFSHIDGIDLSHKMVEEAQKTGVYQTLIGWCNINEEPPFFLLDQYDLTIAAGVFTLDMVTPASFGYLLQITKPGGAIAVSTRTLWYDTYDFRAYYEKMAEGGYIELLDSKMNAPYLTGEFDAHYWVFAVKNNQIRE